VAVNAAESAVNFQANPRTQATYAVLQIWSVHKHSPTYAAVVLIPLSSLASEGTRSTAPETPSRTL